MEPKIVRLMAVLPPNRDLQWLKDGLQGAIELELSTLPPYLCGMWSIQDISVSPVGSTCSTRPPKTADWTGDPVAIPAVFPMTPVPASALARALRQTFRHVICCSPKCSNSWTRHGRTKTRPRFQTVSIRCLPSSQRRPQG